MGYYAYFIMGADIDSDDKALEIMNWIAARREKNESSFYPFASAIEREDYMKNGRFSLIFDYAEIWYDYDKEMTELSIAFPDVIFELRIDAENDPDSRKTWYKNGLSVTPGIRSVIERVRKTWYKNGLSVTHRAEIAPLREEEWNEAIGKLSSM